MGEQISNSRDRIELDEHSSAIVFPQGDETFTVTEPELDELVLVNVNVMGEYVRIADNGDGYLLEIHDSDSDTVENETQDDVYVDRIGSSLSLKQALEIGCDIHAFAMAKRGNSFQIDPQGNGGILIDDARKHLPLRFERPDGVENRIRMTDDLEPHLGLYVQEFRNDPSDEWEVVDQLSDSVQPFLVLSSLEKSFSVWTMDMEVLPKQVAEEATLIKNSFAWS